MAEAAGSQSYKVPEEAPDGLAAAAEIHTMRHDTFGVPPYVRHNIGVRAGNIATAVAATYSTGLNHLSIDAIPTGIAYAVTSNLLIGSAIYGAVRAGGNRRMRQAGELQSEVRDALNEPVDVLKPDRKTTVLRWYGCDEAFHVRMDDAVAQSDDDQGKKPKEFDVRIASFGLSAVVEFAKEAGLTHIAVSTKLLDTFPKDSQDPAAYGKVVSNDSLIRRRRVAATDLSTDKTVLLCDMKGAEELAKHAQAVPMRVVMELLKQTSRDHPFLPWAQQLLNDGYGPVTVERGRQVLRDRVNAGDDLELRAVKFHDMDGDFAGFARTEVFSVLRGKERVSMGIGPQPDGSHESYYRGRVNLLRAAGFETLKALITDTYKDRKSLQTQVVRERAELAAWLLLHEDERKGLTIPGGGGIAGSEDLGETFLERVMTEKPRSVLWHLRATGRHRGGEPTIKYHKRGIPVIRRAMATLAMFGTFMVTGAAAGYVLSKGNDANYKTLEQSYALSHGDKNGQPSDTQSQDFLDNYLSRASGLHGLLNRAYFAASDFDTAITDAFSPYVPPSLAHELAPYADPNWEFQKESALQGLDNVYDQGGNSASIGDVYTNLTDVAWQLTPSSGSVSTKGYWAQSMQDYLDASDGLSNYPSWTPPYQNFGMDFESDDNFGTEALTEYPVRTVDLQNPALLRGQGLIQVEGKRYFTSSEMALIHLPDPLGPQYDTNLAQGYALPVLLGADVVAAQARVYSLDGKYLGANNIRVIQLRDGTFYMIMDTSTLNTSTPSYVDISYLVKPDAKTALPVQAKQPMLLGQSTTFNQSSLLTKGLREADALKVWRVLSGDPHATTLPSAEEADVFIRARKGYSFTPYADSGIQLTLSKPATVSTGLGVIGATAAAMPVENCNVTETIAVIASEGRTNDGGFVDNMTGYVSDGGDALLTGDAHDWLMTNKGQVVDGVPSGASLPKTQTQPFNPAASPANEVLGVAEKGLETVLLLGLAYGGVRVARRYGPAVARDAAVVGKAVWLAPAVRSLQIPKPPNEREGDHPTADLRVAQQPERVSQPKSVASGKYAQRLRQIAERRARLQRLASIVMWMDGAGSFEGTALNESVVPAYFERLEAGGDLPRRYNGLAVRSGRQMRNQVDRLVNEGKLTLRPGTKRELIQFARSHRRAQPVLRPKQLSVEQIRTHNESPIVSFERWA